MLTKTLLSVVPSCQTTLMSASASVPFPATQVISPVPDTVIHPGHAEDTSVATEWEGNPFIRIWRGLDPEGQESCTALGEQATLILMAPDYDGGTKAWVRWQDGSDDIVPGSRVERKG